VAPSIVRFASQAYFEGEKSLAQVYISSVVWFAVTAVCLLSIISVALAETILFNLGFSHEEIASPRLFIALVGGTAICGVLLQSYRAVFMAARESYLASSWDVGSRIFSSLGAGIAAITQLDPVWALVGYFAGQVLAVVLMGAHLGIREILPFYGLNKFSFIKLKLILPFSFEVGLASFVNFLFAPLNRLIIARIIGLEAVAIYEVGYNAAMQLRNIIERGIATLSPEIAKFSQTSDYTNILAIIRNFALIGILPVSIVWVTLMLLAQPLLALWLGESYIDVMAACFQYLLVGSFFSLLASIGYYILLGTGRSREVLYANIIQSGASLLGVLVLVLSGRSVEVGDVAILTSVGMLLSCIYIVTKSGILLSQRI
jgi:O-antigen/teichoic acid export membrane protein